MTLDSGRSPFPLLDKKKRRMIHRPGPVKFIAGPGRFIILSSKSRVRAGRVSVTNEPGPRRYMQKWGGGKDKHNDLFPHKAA